MIKRITKRNWTCKEIHCILKGYFHIFGSLELTNLTDKLQYTESLLIIPYISLKTWWDAISHLPGWQSVMSFSRTWHSSHPSACCVWSLRKSSHSNFLIICHSKTTFFILFAFKHHLTSTLTHLCSAMPLFQLLLG